LVNDNLGFTRDNINDLARQIKFDRASARITVRTQYGQKYSQTIEIIGANGNSKRVVLIGLKPGWYCKTNWYGPISETQTVRI
jgi:hypothetical protein